VYYLYGKEQFLVHRALTAIKDAVLEQATQSFNLDTIDCAEGSRHAERILAAARTLPMMARRRLVIVRDADRLPPSDLELLLPYIARPSETTCLVFVAQDADLRRRFFMELKKRGGLVRFDPPYENRLPAWVEEEAKALGHPMESGAAQLLVDIVGNDLAQLAQALERLSLFVGPGKRISVDAVEEVCAETRQHTVFDLANAVGSRDAKEALRLLHGMLRAREPAPRILVMLTRHFRQLWMARVLKAQRTPPVEMARLLGIAPFFVDGLVRQAAHFSEAQLGRAFEALFSADRQLKSSHSDDRLILERLVLQLTGSSPA